MRSTPSKAIWFSQLSKCRTPECPCGYRGRRQLGRLSKHRRSSTLSRRLSDKRRGDVLNLLASALRTLGMTGFMFSKMFGMFEHFPALLAPVLVSRHGIPPTRKPARHAGQIPPAARGSVITHSSAGKPGKRKRVLRARRSSDGPQARVGFPAPMLFAGSTTRPHRAIIDGIKPALRKSSMVTPRKRPCDRIRWQRRVLRCFAKSVLPATTT